MDTQTLIEQYAEAWVRAVKKAEAKVKASSTKATIAKTKQAKASTKRVRGIVQNSFDVLDLSNFQQIIDFKHPTPYHIIRARSSPNEILSINFKNNQGMSLHHTFPFSNKNNNRVAFNLNSGPFKLRFAQFFRTIRDHVF